MMRRASAVMIALLCATYMATGFALAQSGVHVSDIEFSNTEPIEGEEIVIRVTLFNNNSTAISNLTVVFFVDGEDIGNISGISMEANETRVLEQEWTAEGGTHNVSAIIQIGGEPIPFPAYWEEITVAIGDITSLLLVLAVIVLVIPGTALTPAILDRIRN